MAEAVADDDFTNSECGFCFQTLSSLTKSTKTLPCYHAHCLDCLTGQFEAGGLISCPISDCRYTSSARLSDLPDTNSLFCDNCTYEGKTDQLATIYCETCRTPYCTQHEKLHDEQLNNEDHVKSSIQEYRASRSKLGRKECAQHSLPFTKGCRECLQVICSTCPVDLFMCGYGKSHEYVNLEDLVKQLTVKFNECKAGVLEREGRFVELFKRCSQAESEYSRETEELLQTVALVSGDQVQDNGNAVEVKGRYRELRADLLERRAAGKCAINRYMEEDVGIALADLTKQRLKVEAVVNHSHQVDLVSGYRELQERIQSLLEGDMPTLEFETCRLKESNKCGDIELQLDTSHTASIDWERGLTISKSIPKSLKLVKRLNLPDHCNSVCVCQGNTYVALWDGSIIKIDRYYETHKFACVHSNYMFSVAAHGDRIYAYPRHMYYSTFRVHVYNLNREQIASWYHRDSNYRNQIVVLDDRVVIANRENYKLSVYSLTGQVIRHIPCPQLSSNDLALCAVGNDSVIVSEYKSSVVFRFNISAELMLWTCKDITKPQGVACYDRFVLVAPFDRSSIHILDVNTGATLSSIAVEGGLSGPVPDLHIYGDKLIIAAYMRKQLLFCQLEY